MLTTASQLMEEINWVLTSKRKRPHIKHEFPIVTTKLRKEFMMSNYLNLNGPHFPHNGKFYIINWENLKGGLWRPTVTPLHPHHKR